ncbi:MAG TPA: MucB/RseB C-terminal domain-containing protein [Burkholderiaceae bacterium]|nr:MucB/RseB C-terminal domain-containing protein [Burkholderiaceae bacterium]
MTAALCGPAAAQTARAGGAAQERTDAQWLQAIQSAAQRLNYSGTIVYQRGAEVRASRIVHAVDGGVVYERLSLLDGRPLEFIRRADEVQCLIPDARRIIVEHRRGGDAFPALTNTSPAEILHYYGLKVGGAGRVAELDCQMLQLEPRDAFRYGYRFCVDVGSGLLLKSQTLDERRQVIEQITFTEVRIGEPTDPARLKPSWPIDGWQVEHSDARPTDLARAGWTIVVPDGFRAMTAVSRRIAGRPAVQAIYSDGLATFSVFIESRPTVGAESARTHGPLNAVTRRVGDTLVTVVGEVPAATVRGVAAAVTPRTAQ